MRRSLAIASSFAVVIALSVSGCKPEAQPPSTSATAYYHYVLLASDESGKPVAFARVIIAPGDPCPTITGDQTLPMSKRDNPHGFSVDVCEAVIPFDSDLQIETGTELLTLPTARTDPVHILAMGDTGCKSKTCSGPASPFDALASVAAAKSWDLILHMGDYNYRGTSGVKPGGDYPYDAGDGSPQSADCEQAPDSGFVSQNTPDGQYRDQWETWRDDFFLPASSPAGNLLSAAPWILARGNHELCSRAGPGWFYFLDPGSALLGSGGPQLSCPTPDPDKNPIDSVILGKPYAVDLGSLNVVVLDSANACDAFAPAAAQDFLDAYASQFSAVDTLASGSQHSWLMTHRPIWGVQSYEAGSSTACSAAQTYSCVNQTLQYGIANSSSGRLAPGIDLSLAGHMHHFQSLTFPSDTLPPQLIIGDGGVELGDYGPGTGTMNPEPTIAGLQAQGVAIGVSAEVSGTSVPGYGFLEISYGPNGAWTGSLSNLQASVELASCGVPVSESGVCSLNEGTTGQLEPTDP